MNRIFFIITLLYYSNTYSQFVKPHAQLKSDLKKHILFLANDSLQGRATGTRGEALASDYIIKQFTTLGLQPMMPYDNYLQPFKYTSKVYLGKKNTLKYIESGNNGSFPLYKAFYPLNSSGSGVAFARAITAGFGISAPKMNHDDYAPLDKENIKGKIFVIKVGYPDAKIHSTYAEYDIDYRIDLAIKNGAAGIVFINDQDSAFNPDSGIHIKGNRKSIPIVFCGNKRITSGRVSKDPVFFIETEIIKEEKTGHNVIAFINNKAENTVVIGAHYDHLGLGEISGSLHKGAPATHNGADDNASGVAALLELAGQLKDNPKASGNNYIFVAFSGEELGLYGSKHFVNDMGFGIQSFNYMLNMDMVGRLDSTKNILAVSGTGTSPQWVLLDSIKNLPFNIKKSESGVGPSDHTSFYKEKIPVLHFFTGNHNDYHKPSDDEIYINYEGEAQVIYFMYNIILQMDKQGKLPFTASKDNSEGDRPRFKVTMGIMPDYMYEGSGIKVDGVTAEKPAAIAGIQKGDIIIDLGGIKTTDMQQYVKALGGHEKGDKVPCKLLRGGKEVVVQVVF
ncbi:MAG: M28 family peptidase [Bacteroidota bacterium]|nr:M28 family peptidase [Bacteroidota bacterium]